jgi:hypothetical protein
MFQHRDKKMFYTKSAKIGNINDVVAVLLVTSVAAAMTKQRTRLSTHASKCTRPDNWFPIQADSPDT